MRTYPLSAVKITLRIRPATMHILRSHHLRMEGLTVSSEASCEVEGERSGIMLLRLLAPPRRMMQDLWLQGLSPQHRRYRSTLWRKAPAQRGNLY